MIEGKNLLHTSFKISVKNQPQILIRYIKMYLIDCIDTFYILITSGLSESLKNMFLFHHKILKQ